MTYIAVLNETSVAEGSDDLAYYSASLVIFLIKYCLCANNCFAKMELHFMVKTSTIRVLNHIQLYNYNAKDVPRYIKVNGELLRRGDLHYHRDIKVKK